MKTLLILRHAKSSWGEPNIADHDRPLTERGKKDAKRIGQLLLERGLVPDQILSSTAKRARKTASKVAKACQYAGEVEQTKRLYLASPPEIIQVLREVGDERSTVLVVAHNPGLEELLGQLTGHPQPMPTATLAQVAIDIDRWQSLSVPAGGRLVQVWRPKELG
ncbi:MAG: histidine phosphatase family protein [Pirellulaceae bacterium]|nr:histidine phosphatase family protein [Pirellulaceae bacterium]